MTFYAIDPGLQEAIDSGAGEGRVRIEVDPAGSGDYRTLPEEALVRAEFVSLKEEAGGTSSRGEVVFEDEAGFLESLSLSGGAGAAVRVSFSVGTGFPFEPRFAFFVDSRGFRVSRGPGRARRVLLVLEDLSYSFRRTDEQRDWTEDAVLAYSVVCDKTTPETSLVHRVAARAGLGAADIDCATIPCAVPYARLTRNLWAELSELAWTYRAHLETAIEKPLVFAHSPYQSESEAADGSCYRLDGSNLSYLRTEAGFDAYRNTVRLKFHRSRTLERQEIWRYADAPELYDPGLSPVYPFRSGALRAIQGEGYAGRYRVAGTGGRYLPVLYADQVDDLTAATARLEYSGGPFSYGLYDVAAYRDRALLRLDAAADGELRAAAINGRPIVLELNTASFVRDEAGIARYGTQALNVSGGYFSADLVSGGAAQYEDWARRELEIRSRVRLKLSARTNRALFNARVGATVTVGTAAGDKAATIRELRLLYRRGAAFRTSLAMEEA